ncbi:MAG: proline iminopeptidase-family hydrolase [Propionibacteriaceae bacterium]
MDFDGHQTWYRITGTLDPTAARAPVVILHGGPGAAHNYCLSMSSLAGDGRAVVHYDQLGCGNSTHLPDADPGFWTVDLFVRELRNLVDALGITRFHLLGQSWGGMLGPEVVLDDSAGILSLSICDSPASMTLWLEAANHLRTLLPPDVQETLTRHEEAETTDSAEYKAAEDVFYARHVCRVQPLPQDVADSFDQIDAEPTVYHTMNGPSEFHVIGSLKEWSVVDRVHDISVPTIVVAGEYDEAMPSVWQPFVDRIPDVRSHVFADASHMPHVEQPAEFTQVIGDFLREHDPLTDQKEPA